DQRQPRGEQRVDGAEQKPADDDLEKDHSPPVSGNCTAISPAPLRGELGRGFWKDPPPSRSASRIDLPLKGGGESRISAPNRPLAIATDWSRFSPARPAHNDRRGVGSDRSRPGYSAGSRRT